MFRSGQGWSLVRTWTGARAGADAFILSSVPALFSEITIKEEVDQCTIQATYSIVRPDGSPQVSDPVSVIWTMPNNDGELSIWEHPEIQDFFLSLGNDEAAAQVAIGLRQARGDNKLPSEIDWDKIGFFDADTIALLTAFYRRLLRGIESFPTSQYVLRKVETVVSDSQLKAAHRNVNQIYKADLLAATEPSLLTARLVDYPALSNDPAAPRFWLKRTPVVDEVDRGKFQITQEYWGVHAFDKWIYDEAKS